MSAEIIVHLDTAPANIGDKEREAIETAARAIAMSMKVLGFSDEFRTTRAKLITNANSGVTTVLTPDELESAVRVLSEMATFQKKIDAEEETLKSSLHKPKTALMRFFEAEMEDFLKAKKRVSEMVNHYQTLQLREKEERERKARFDLELAQRTLAIAQRQAEMLTNKEDKLDAQLLAESASLKIANASAQLSVPTNTPRGMSTRVRYDFEIISAINCISKLPEFWTWKKEEEYFKFERAVFLKALNKDEPEANIAALLPDEQVQTVNHPAFGIRIFRDVSVSVRG